MKDWKRPVLEEVCKFVRGPFGGSLKKEIFKAEGYAVYEQQHAIYNQFSDIRYFVDDTKFSEMRRFELSADDLIMSCSGTMGKVAIVPKGIKRGIINQALLKITPSSKIDVKYLRYWMESDDFQGQLSASSAGAAIQNVASVKVLSSMKIPLPPLDEQKRIAAILDQADALRRLRTRALDRFNALGQAIFHEMFGDGSDSTICRLGDLTTKIGSGATPRGGDAAYQPTGIPLIRSMNVRDGAFERKGLAYLNDARVTKAAPMPRHPMTASVSTLAATRMPTR